MTEKKFHTAVFPGSFDPITEGHVDVLRKALKLFDNVVIGVLVNPKKTPMFTAERRADMICAVINKHGARWIEDVHVEVVKKELAVEFAKRVNATHFIRSMRTGFDFEYELEIAWNNLDFGSIETIFIPPEQKHITYRSSTVRVLLDFRRYDLASRFLPEPLNKDPEWMVKR